MVNLREDDDTAGSLDSAAESGQRKHDEAPSLIFMPRSLRLVASPAWPYGPVIVCEQVTALTRSLGDPYLQHLVAWLVEVFDAVFAATPEESYALVVAMCAAGNLITEDVRLDGDGDGDGIAHATPARVVLAEALYRLIPWDWALLAPSIP